MIADGGRARFVARGEEGDFHTIASFVSGIGTRERSHDSGTDVPARMEESVDPPAPHALELCRAQHSAAKEDFVKHVTGEIDGEQEAAGRFDKLVSGWRRPAG